MPPDSAANVRGTEMDDDELAAHLERQGFGVLALADEREAYAVPTSFGYDGDGLYLYLFRFGADSEKLRLLEDTETACLVTYDVDSPSEWESAVVRGPIEEIDDDEADRFEAAIDDNAWFPDLFVSVAQTADAHRCVLRPETASGRKGVVAR